MSINTGPCGQQGWDTQFPDCLCAALRLSATRSIDAFDGPIGLKDL